MIHRYRIVFHYDPSLSNSVPTEKYILLFYGTMRSEKPQSWNNGRWRWGCVWRRKRMSEDSPMSANMMYKLFTRQFWPPPLCRRHEILPDTRVLAARVCRLWFMGDRSIYTGYTNTVTSQRDITTWHHTVTSQHDIITWHHTVTYVSVHFLPPFRQPDSGQLPRKMYGETSTSSEMDTFIISLFLLLVPTVSSSFWMNHYFPVLWIRNEEKAV